MTTKKVTMQKIKEILRLKYGANLSIRQISRSLNISTGVISKYINRGSYRFMVNEMLLYVITLAFRKYITNIPLGEKLFNLTISLVIL